MTAAALVADLRSRGVRLEVHGDRLRFAPLSAVTEAELGALRALKVEVVSLLQDGLLAAPSSPCGLCGSSLVYVEGWPSEGDSRWLCVRCASQPTPSLQAVLASLTDDERNRLDKQRNEGDGLAEVVSLFCCDPSPTSAEADRHGGAK